MIVLERDAPAFEEPSWARLTRASGLLWRVADDRGRPLGHLRAVSDDGRWRFRAERYHGASRAFRSVGEFWAVGDALDCLRYQR